MSGLPPYPGVCDVAKYPPSGGDGYGKGACDEWPPVAPAAVKGCSCPPDGSTYELRRKLLKLNFLPIVGQLATHWVGMPKNCAQAFQESANEWSSAQAAWQQQLNEAGQDFNAVLDALQEIYVPDSVTGQVSGILPTAMQAALAPAEHVAAYLIVILVAVFCLLAGVGFTL
jgi:hypothetical protein